MKCSKTLSICAGAKGEGVLSASLQGLGARERGLILLCVDVTFTVSLRHARQSPNLLGMQRWKKKKRFLLLGSLAQSEDGEGASLLMAPDSFPWSWGPGLLIDFFFFSLFFFFNLLL